MRSKIAILSLCVGSLASAVVIDRIAVVVGNSIVKDSDIDRNIRVTSFLNGSKLDFSAASRKAAANRLIDQIFIRKEIDVGGYTTVSAGEADEQLNKLINQRFRSNAVFEAELARYGINRLDLREQFLWQLTVLRFIDVRFRPAVMITDDEIEKYYQDHAVELRRQYPGKSINELRPTIQEILSGEQVNQQFFSWLDQQHKDNKVQFLEGSLG